MDEHSIISVNHLSKSFKLPHEKKSSLKSVFVNMFSKKKTFDIQKVLDNISFDINKGEFFGITGRNGSGKSTMLKILAGIYSPTKGDVHIKGKLTPFIELGVGFNPELTGRENVFLNGALLGFSRKEMLKMYDEIVEFAELEKFMDQKLKNYSSGMQVRLAFSIAIRAQSDILLIDEVLAVGDINFQNKCIAVFEEIKRRGTTVVFVSHDMEAVRRFCDRVALIQDGKLVRIGDAQKVIDDYLTINSGNEVSKGSPFGVDSVTIKDDSVAKISKTILRNSKLQVARNIREDTYYVDLEVEFKKDCEDIVPGIVVRNSAGQRVTASNSEWVGLTLPSYKKGDKITFRFSFQNILERGIYFVSSNIISSKTRQFYDWDNDSANFKVDSKPATGGIVNPHYTVEEL